MTKETRGNIIQGVTIAQKHLQHAQRTKPNEDFIILPVNTARHLESILEQVLNAIAEDKQKGERIMKACWCSLAGTAACRSCSNNPYADFPPTVRTNTVTVTDRTFYTQSLPSAQTIDDVIQKLEYIMEGDPRTFSNPECEYGWIFHGVNEAIKMLKEIEKNLPPAQPELIHCKDCYHYPGECTDCPMIGWGRNGEDFCSKAERRTDG